MYEDHPDVSTPPDDTVIWRYMNLERLLALLCDKSLFMCRLDKFRDPWEGVWPKPLLDIMSSGRPDRAKVHRAKALNDFAGALTMSLYVSCWHASEYESAALWDSYAARAGLAIKSTCGQLKSAIECEDQFYVGEVSYRDYSRDGSDLMPSAFIGALLKRKSFEHEREVRVLIWNPAQMQEYGKKESDLSPEAAGRSIHVNLPTLIDAVYLSPTSPSWLLPYVRTLLSKFDVQGCEVIRSQLYDEYVL